MKLSDHIGKDVVMLIPFIHQTKLQTVLLHGVESGGVWIESQSLINAFLTGAGAVSSSNKTMIVFLPYSQITCVYSAIDGPMINESAFGL